MARQIDYTKVSDSCFLIKGEGEQSNECLILVSTYSENLCFTVKVTKTIDYFNLANEKVRLSVKFKRNQSSWSNH